MGLSNEERMDRIVCHSNHIFQLACEIETAAQNDDKTVGVRDDIIRVCQSAKTVWHALYGNTTKASYWLFGGSVGNEVKQGSGDPLFCAIRHAIENAKPKSEVDEMMEKFDRENYFEDQLEHIYLVRNASQAIGGLLKLYSHLESIIYALRRYDDRFMASFASLDALVSSLYGQCYNIFLYSPVLIQCYLITDICKLLIRNETFKEVLKKLNLQHNVGYTEFRDINELVAIHKIVHESLVVSAKGIAVPPLDTCVKMFLELAGKRFHYDHQFRDLKKFIEDKKEQVDWAAAENLFRKNADLQKKDEKKSSSQYRGNDSWGHMTAVHGFEYCPPVKKENVKPVTAAKKSKKTS